jgi:hypothetical protein
MRLLASLFAVSLLVLGLALWPVCSAGTSQVGELADARAVLPAQPVRLRCGHPGRLRLQRFEDGSAQLRCADRVLARVSVPW